MILTEIEGKYTTLRLEDSEDNQNNAILGIYTDTQYVGIELDQAQIKNLCRYLESFINEEN
nr:MAG TPA: hypothetical protein [Caudoviricetes sp.]